MKKIDLAGQAHLPQRKGIWVCELLEEAKDRLKYPALPLAFAPIERL